MSRIRDTLNVASWRREFNKRADELVAWRAGLIGEPAWHRRAGQPTTQ